MKFKIHIDGAEHQIEAAADGSLILDGESFQIKVGNPSDDRRTVQLEGKTYEVRIVENCLDAGITVLELAGERVPMTVTDVAKAVPAVGAAAAGGPAAAAGAAGSAALPAPGTAPGGGESPAAGAADAPGKGTATPAEVLAEVKNGIWAPVPGKIVDVFVKAGDVVEEGTAVLVLEAMKMENELHAPYKGTVAAVMVKKGDQAEKGQLLVSFA